MPFAFNWAKESWTTTWQGKFSAKPLTQGVYGNPNMLMEQITPDPLDPRVTEHYNNFLRRFFHHKNYIKVNGAPLFSIYGVDAISPATRALIARLRELAMQDGFPSPGLHVPLIMKMSAHALYHDPGPQTAAKAHDSSTSRHPQKFRCVYVLPF